MHNHSRISFEVGQPAGTKTYISLSDSLEILLVWCPAGTFIMGDKYTQDENSTSGSNQLVTLTRGFWICCVPVTQKLWETIIGKKFRATRQQNDSTIPVVGVSWTTAMHFCDTCNNLLHEREFLRSTQKITLPSEAQWEYACRANTQTKWHFGNDEFELGSYAWYNANSNDEPHPVGLKLPNPWNIYDLYGNVWEWCLDSFSLYQGVAQTDPCNLQESELKISRGGAYSTLAEACQSATRNAVLQDNPFTEDLGFRIVCIEQ